MNIGNLLVNAAYLGNKVLTDIAVGATKVWEGVSKYIKFKDPVVEQLCMKWSSDGIGLTPEDAAKVTNIGTTFKENTEITSFEELGLFGVTKIESAAFVRCYNLRRINLSNITYIGYRAFGECILEQVNLSSIQYLMGDSFQNNNAAITHIGKELRYLGANAFRGLEPPYISLSMPNLTFCKESAFEGITGSFKGIDSLGSITSIPNRCFFENGFEYVTLHSGITSIGTYAFLRCRNLKYIKGLLNLNSVGERAFDGCTSLVSIAINNTTPPTLGSGVFTSCNNLSIYVPDESVDAYKSATNWSVYADRIKPLSEYVEPTNE